MPLTRFLFFSLLAFLCACGGGALELNLNLDKTGGLKAGDPIVVDARPVGQVLAVEPGRTGGFVAKLNIQPEFRSQATETARYVVARDPDHPDQRRVELRPGAAGAPALADGASVQGSVEPEPLFPLREMLKGLTEGLGVLRDQVERLRSEMQRLPQSEEGIKLKKEWERLQEEMKRAQEAAEDSVQRDIIPKLQEQLDEIEKRFKALENQPKPKSSPI